MLYTLTLTLTLTLLHSLSSLSPLLLPPDARDLLTYLLTYLPTYLTLLRESVPGPPYVPALHY